jgi:UDP-3-O-[3-hydroxymyristoyl] glucosamine N-acyltransferase
MIISARALAERLHGTVNGDGDVQISGVAPIARAGAGDVTFADSPRSCEEAFAGPAGVILVRHNALTTSKTVIRVDNCREAFAIAMTLFNAPKEYLAGVAPSANIGVGVQLGEGVFIGPNVVLGKGAQVGDCTAILANCVVAEGAVLGADCLLYPNVTIYSHVKIGARVIVHSGTVIGSDGFGYARKASGIAKIPQIGGVTIGDDVEIGANVSIDRATMNSTVIGSGTKIDNQVQIAHNVVIGRNCLIAGQTGIGGSASLGDNVTLAGRVAVVDHVKIGANAVVGATSLVTKDVPPGQVVWGTPARRGMDAKKEIAALRRLPALLKEMRSQRQANVGDQPELEPHQSGD